MVGKIFADQLTKFLPANVVPVGSTTTPPPSAATNSSNDKGSVEFAVPGASSCADDGGDDARLPTPPASRPVKKPAGGNKASRRRANVHDETKYTEVFVATRQLLGRGIIPPDDRFKSLWDGWVAVIILYR